MAAAGASRKRPAQDGGAAARRSERSRKKTNYLVDAATREMVREAALAALEQENEAEDTAAVLGAVVDDEETMPVGAASRRPAARGTRAAQSLASASKLKAKPKTLEQLLAEDSAPPPNYRSAAARPSCRPPRRFCASCGFPAPYTCVRCGTRFCSLACDETHQATRCLKFIS
jgi:zinc finger HIT domain-containing protein 1